METKQAPRILIVEDDPSFQEIYEEILGEEYALHIAANKELAIESVRNQVFDLAIIDMRLKAHEKDNVDGLIVARFIRDLNILMPIILKSGFPTGTPEVNQQMAELKLFAILDKSTEGQVKELRAVVAQAASQAHC